MRGAEKALSNAAGAAGVVGSARRRRLVAPFPGVEDTSAPSGSGGWRIGRRLLFIMGSAAVLWLSIFGLVKLMA